MSRRVVALTGDSWERMTAPCRACMFWELGERPGGRGVDADRQAIRKQEWTTVRVREGDPPGRAIEVEGTLAGFVLFAPARDMERAPGGMPRSHNDALVLATMWIDPVHRNEGLGRMLLQATIKEAMRLRLAAVEVRADRRWRPGDCVLPITWLLHEGFEVVDEHVRWPLLRLDVGRTVRWTESVEQAVGDVLGLLPQRAPAPRPAVEAGLVESTSPR